MKEKTEDANDIIEYGLDSIDPNEKIEVDLKDINYVYKTFEEVNRFFHQPMHYPELKNVEQYLGNKDRGHIQ